VKVNIITIENFRQLESTSLTFENDITVLAGPNNSGKTTFVGLLKSILTDGKMKYCKDDIPAIKATMWIEEVFPIFLECFLKHCKQEDVITNILNIIYPANTNIHPKIIEPSTIKIQIDYDLENDDIRNFADYIMELDEDINSFFFIYSFKFNLTIFKELLEKNYEKLKIRFSQIDGGDRTKLNILKEMIIDIYANSIVPECNFCDKDYSNQSKIDIYEFRKLFNFKCINAGRILDDTEKDSSHTLSKGMISLASKDEEWKGLLKELPDKILEPIQSSKIRETVRKTSVKTLSNTMNSLSKTNGGHAGEILLEIAVSEDDISDLLKRTTCAKYHLDGHYLDESSQGLGYSNMIYIHLQIEEFKKTIEPDIVNIFFIEEPESHMHPQMQNVFIKYLLRYYKELNLQGLVTTHSNEIARVTGLSHLRVIRETSLLNSEIFDLSRFKKSVSTSQIDHDDILENFYDYFFEIGFSEIVFADKAILYEGDTERLFIKKLITLSKYKNLSEQYVSFIQVGGAYAYNYRLLIEFLKIKTLIITDIDYDKAATTETDVKLSYTTNASINKFYKISISDNQNEPDPSVGHLYWWSQMRLNIFSDNLICVKFQTEDDNYARTLEEAMLAKHYNINTFDMKPRSEWIKLRSKDNLKYSIPNNRENEIDSEFSLRHIVLATSKSKTDFMYSVIMYGLAESMTPNYIEEGLDWLMEK
jgi:predicted ATP-dependent endonuclease of OLD family